MKKIIIAIDGYSSCGKSTMAKQLAKRLGYVYIDTGAMYRAVTLFALQNGFIAKDKIDTESLHQALDTCHITFRMNEQGNPETHLNGENVESEIRSLRVSSNVSPIATLPFVREHLVAQQQLMGREKGIVMDGRDIGTVVFPDAELKIFVTASAEVRAKRRYDELQAKGQNVSFDEILKNVQERDYIDSHREVSPLRKADDAIEFDNSHMTLEEQDEWLMQRVSIFF